MARIQFRDDIEALRGTIDGMVFYGYYGKNYLRVRRETHDPGTEKQLIMRKRFTAAVHAWQALTPKEREYWRARGRRTRRNGYNAFLSCYMVHMQGDGLGENPSRREDAFRIPSVSLLSPFVPTSLERVPSRFYMDSLRL